MAKKKAVFRTRRGRTTVDVFGGKATGQQLDRDTVKKIQDKHKTVHEDGRVEYDNEAIGFDMFKEMLVAIEGYSDEDGNELQLDDKFKDDAINLNPDFFREFTQKINTKFEKREDLAAKNS